MKDYAINEEEDLKNHKIMSTWFVYGPKWNAL